jgi:YVTN family beta-propeller protein
VAVDPSVKFVYVANQSSGDVSGYTIDSTTGALTQITGSNPSPFTVAPNGSGPFSVAVDPSGKFVYVANNFSNNVSGFTIDPGTGALMPIAGSPFSDPALFNPQPTSVAVDPSGKFVYVTNAGTNSVSGFSIASNGVLTLLGNFLLGSPATNPRSVAVDPSGKFVYVANLGSNTVSGFTIDPGTGALTLIGSPFTVPGGGKQPRSVAVDPSGKFVYVVNQGTGNVSGFTITPGTGVLTPFTGSPFPAGLFPHSVAVGGKFAYVTNQGGGAPGTVSGYTIDSTTGALTEIPPINQPGGSPFPTGWARRAWLWRWCLVRRL